MGLTYEEARRLGLAEQHPDHSGGPVAKRKVSLRNCLGQNKTEAEFDRYLAKMLWARKIAEFRFEPLKLRLAGRTYYSPDFLVKLLDGSLVFFEIKGFMRDDAAVKLKTAAEQFAWLGRFYLVRKDRACHGGWDVRRVDRGGIGKHPISELWLDP